MATKQGSLADIDDAYRKLNLVSLRTWHVIGKHDFSMSFTMAVGFGDNQKKKDSSIKRGFWPEMLQAYDNCCTPVRHVDGSCWKVGHGKHRLTALWGQLGLLIDQGC